jgi:hypothetical protein
MSPLATFFALVGAVLAVWLRIVRPIRGDLAWSRQGKRIAAARARRLRRRASA